MGQRVVFSVSTCSHTQAHNALSHVVYQLMYVATLAFFFWIDTMSYSNIASYSAAVYIALLNAPIEVALFKLSVGVTFICSVSCDTLTEKLKRTWNMYDQLNWTLDRNSAIESRRPFLSIIKDSIMYATSRECGRCLCVSQKRINIQLVSAMHRLPRCRLNGFSSSYFIFLNNNNEPYFNTTCPWGNVRSAKRQRRCTKYNSWQFVRDEPLPFFRTAN